MQNDASSCPDCGYSLAGLPASGTCPECGFDYDPHARVLRLNPWQYYCKQTTVVGALVLLYYLSGGSDGALRVDEWVFWLGVIGFCVICNAWDVARRIGRRPRVILNGNGVRFVVPGVGVPFISWRDVGKAQYSWFANRFHIIAPDGTVIVKVGAEKIGTPWVLMRCARAINELRGVYGCGGQRSRRP